MPNREKWIHILVWVIYCAILIYIRYGILSSNGRGVFPERLDLNTTDFNVISSMVIHTLSIVLFQAAVFYLNYLFLLPKFFARSKFVKYVLGIILTILSANLIIYQTNEWLIKPMRPRVEQQRLNAPFKPMGPKPPKPDKPMLFAFMVTIFELAPSLFLSTILWVAIQNRKRENLTMNLKNESLETEMKFLKSQINPHFLFNALNNIYSLSYTQSKETSPMILRLSNMLRYMVYETAQRKTILEKEISYINDFIAFQKLRIGQEINVVFETGQVDLSTSIEPILLIPFVENAFKHGDIESNMEGYIKISLEKHRNILSFQVINSMSPVPFTKDEVGGVGIENVKKRLAFAYPEKHTFTIDGTDETHSIHLTIDTE